MFQIFQLLVYFFTSTSIAYSYPSTYENTFIAIFILCLRGLITEPTK